MSRYTRLLHIAASASPERLERCEKAIYPKACRAVRKGALTEAQLERVLLTLSQKTKVSIAKVRRSYRQVSESDPTLYNGLTLIVPYAVRDSRICVVKTTTSGPVFTPLCNFDARIVEERERDDGLERTRTFRIEGSLDDGTRLPATEVSASAFSAMTWPLEAWGSKAVVYAGQGTKDQLRAGIQHLSVGVEPVRIYTHLGWREVDGAMLYLHADGAIGADGPVEDIRVDPPQGLENFVLPPPPTATSLTEAVRASLELLELAPSELTVPLLASSFRAVLGGTDFSLHVVSETGVGKSEIVALVQQHHGPNLDARHLPASWSSTANSLEELAFSAKDTLLVVDDFAPGGSRQDIARLEAAAARLLRAQGNGSARGRMYANGSLRAPRPPRGMLLSTGEDVPSGHSIRARTLVLELGRGTLKWERLSDIQEKARRGVLASALSGFVCRVAGNFEGYQASFWEYCARYRRELTRNGHSRTTDAGAQLLATLTIVLDFAVEVGAIDEARREALWEQARVAVTIALTSQASLQASNDPVVRFVELLADSLSSGRVHIRNYSNGSCPGEGWGWKPNDEGSPASRLYRPQGSLIGWKDGDDLYLNPSATFAEVQRFAGEQQVTLPVTEAVLWKRLDERKLLLSKEGSRLKVKRTPHGAGRTRVLHVGVSMFEKVGHVGPDE